MVYPKLALRKLKKRKENRIFSEDTECGRNLETEDNPVNKKNILQETLMNERKMDTSNFFLFLKVRYND